MLKIKLLDIKKTTKKKKTHIYNQYIKFAKSHNLFLNQYENEEVFFKSLKGEAYCAWEGEICIGFFHVVKSNDWGNNPQNSVNILVDREYSNKELEKNIVLFLKEINKSEIQLAVTTYNKQYTKLLLNLNGKIQMNFNKYALDKNRINVEMLDKWIVEIEKNNPDLSLIFRKKVPSEYLEEYCDLFMETSADMTDTKEEGFIMYNLTPKVQRELNNRKVTGSEHWAVFVINKDNKMIGMSNVSVGGKFPRQFMIGIKKNYRGRKIGKWMYAALYKKIILESEFEKLHLEHHEENIPAIGLSLKTGYEFCYNQMKIIYDKESIKHEQ